MDKSKSDSPRPHLQTLGLPELAIGAADKLQISLHIVQHSTTGVMINHISELGQKERTYTFGEEYREPDRSGGVIRFLVDLSSPTEMLTRVHMGPCTLSEKKSVQGQAGDLLIQTVVMTVKGVPGSTSTTRVYQRKGLSPPLLPAEVGGPGPVV